MGIYVAKASAIRDLLLNHFPEVGSHISDCILTLKGVSRMNLLSISGLQSKGNANLSLLPGAGQ